MSKFTTKSRASQREALRLTALQKRLLVLIATDRERRDAGSLIASTRGKSRAVVDALTDLVRAGFLYQRLDARYGLTASGEGASLEVIERAAAARQRKAEREAEDRVFDEAYETRVDSRGNRWVRSREVRE